MNVYNFQKIPSGIMFNAWDAHYRQVNVLRFTVDGQALVSGSEDSGVGVWSMSSLLDNASQNDLVSPYASLSDHTLPVTDIICGIGVFPFCRILTASVDHSVKLWDLSSRALLTTFQFPRPITTVAWDITERVFFAASDDGSIHQVNLFRQRRDKFGREAVGGAGSADVVRVNEEDEQAAKRRLISVGEPVASLAISLSSSLLLVGTTTGIIQVFDIASHQPLRSITTHKGFSITYISTMLKPPDLVGHISLNLNGGGATDPRDTIPVRPVVAFQRMRDPKAREAHEVAMMLPIPPSKPPTSFFSYSMDELVRDQVTFVQPSSSQSEPSGASLQTRVGELEAEVTKLREQLVKAKTINDTMWETVVHKVIVGGQNKDRSKEDDMMQTDSEEDEGRSHKKSRT
ncbi:hypothetical protein NLI96_g11667 [Meripilus lineatus]|uniref:Pre-rRNA-processing protein IPI3 n=1 Tax=Meripilus lineatus TaxID=2056292 RepID=A0AAD5URG1_9APHY|nr:hypothetical protein NLI96_g11667 [Physisporinus lineatus]